MIENTEIEKTIKYTTKILPQTEIFSAMRLFLAM